MSLDANKGQIAEPNRWVVRPLEHSTVKSLSQRNGTMKTTVVVLTTLLGAGIGVHAQSLLTNGSFEALGPGTTFAPR